MSESELKAAAEPPLTTLTDNSNAKNVGDAATHEDEPVVNEIEEEFAAAPNVDV